MSEITSKKKFSQNSPRWDIEQKEKERLAQWVSKEITSREYTDTEMKAMIYWINKGQQAKALKILFKGHKCPATCYCQKPAKTWQEKIQKGQFLLQLAEQEGEEAEKLRVRKGTASELHLKNIEANYNLTSPQPKQTGYLNQEKNFFIKQLIKDLQLKDLSKQAIFTKSEQLKNKFKRISQSDDIGFALDWIQEVITTLFLKHSQLEKESRHYYTELEKKESQFLAELGAMFLNDWIYYYDQRESKYNQHYQSHSSQPVKTASDILKKLSKKQENS